MVPWGHQKSQQGPALAMGLGSHMASNGAPWGLDVWPYLQGKLASISLNVSIPNPFPPPPFP